WWSSATTCSRIRGDLSSADRLYALHQVPSRSSARVTRRRSSRGSGELIGVAPSSASRAQAAGTSSPQRATAGLVEAEGTVVGPCALDVACESDDLRRSKEPHFAPLPRAGEPSNSTGGSASCAPSLPHYG